MIAVVHAGPYVADLLSGVVTALLFSTAIFGFAAAVLFFRRVIGLDS